MIRVRDLLVRRVSGHASLCAALLLLLLGSAGAAHAQSAGSTLSGVVTDASGGIVPHVVLELVDGERGVRRTAQTDERGRYEFTDVPAGTYVLTSSGIVGFEPLRIEGIALDGRQPRMQPVRLRVAALSEQVAVSGRDAASVSAFRTARSLREIPQSVSVITQQRMQVQGLTALTDVLQQATGVTLSQGGNAGSDSAVIYSRGFAIDNYQVDGLRHLHSNYSSIFQSNDMTLYDRVEVLRGATGLLNGIGSPGGAINLVRKRPTAARQTTATIEAGSWDSLRAEVDLSSPLNAAGTIRGRVVAAWQDGASYIDRFEEARRIAYGVVDVDLSPSTVATVGLTFQRHNATGHARSGLPAFYADGTRTRWERSDSGAANWASSERDNRSVFGRIEHAFANRWQLEGTLLYDRTAFDEVLGYAAGEPDPATGTGMSLWAGRWAGPPVQKSVDVVASGPWSLFGREHELTAGMALSRTTQDSESYNLWYWSNGWSPDIADYRTWDGNTPAAPDNPPTGDFNYRERTSSAYATARIHLIDALSIVAGGRLTSWFDENYRRSYETGIEAITTRREPNQLTPYAGLIYDIGRRWSVYASYTSIFRPQSARDQAGDFLPPLTGNSYEGGAKAELLDGQLNLSGALYEIQQDNLAIAMPGVFTPDGGTASRPVSGTRTRGAEFELSGRLTSGWQASFGLAHNVTRDRDALLLKTEAPQTTIRLFTSYAIPTSRGAATVGTGVRWQSDIWSDYDWLPGSPRVTQDGYAIVDLMARVPIASRLALTINVDNLLDAAYLAGSYTAYYGPPRNARVGLDVAF